VPIRFVQRIDSYGLATARRMNELVVAQVNGDVVDVAALDVEEQQITGFQILAIHRLTMTLGYGIGGAWPVDLTDIRVGAFDQSAAIQAFTGRVAAPAIRRAHSLQGALYNGVALLGRGRSLQGRDFLGVLA